MNSRTVLDMTQEEWKNFHPFGNEEERSVSGQISKEAFDYLDMPVERVATADVPVPFSPSLEEYMMANTEDIVAAAKRLMG